MSSTLGFFVLIIVATLSTILVAPHAEAARAFFVFGDSLVDSGNNNYLATTARADSPPNGIDYPTHRPTGRFSNGLNLPDIISEFSFFLSFFFQLNFLLLNSNKKSNFLNPIWFNNTCIIQFS